MAAPINVPGYERIKHPNHFNYTDDELGQKKLAIKTMLELYPGVNPLHAEWVYDLCKNSSQEEIDKMKEKIDTVPSRYVAKPQEVYTMEIIDSEDSLMNKITEKKNIDSIIKDESSEK